MRTPGLLLAVALAAGLAACSKPVVPPPPKDATIKDIMDSMVDPSGDFLFQSIEQISDEKGIREKAPTTDADWAAVEHHLAVLHQAPEYLIMPGRKGARPTDRSRAPGVENEPWEVQALLDSQHDEFVRRARALQAASDEGMKAAKARDKTALSAAILSIDKACESCHLHFWYPNDKRAHQAAKEEGILE
jgi:cytochrome c556